MNMKLIVGLGNPGDKYLNTRHNIWFIMIEQFVKSNNFWDFSYNNKYGAEFLETQIDSLWLWEQEKIFFLKPMEYMNRSWIAVQKIMKFYKIDIKDLLVIHDDIDLPVAKIQFKLGWWLAGHNWLKDIAEKLWTKDFARVRIWIDRPIQQSQVSDYVLWKFKKDEIEKIQDNYLDLDQIILEFIK